MQKNISIVQKKLKSSAISCAVRIRVLSLSGQANLVWACDDVVIYFSSSGRFQLQYRSKILGPKYACNARLRVRDARVCVFDTRMKCASKGKSLVFMS